MTFPKLNKIVAEKYVAGMSLLKSKLAKENYLLMSRSGSSPKAKKDILNYQKVLTDAQTHGTFLNFI